MTWFTISGAGVTTASKFYGDAMNNVSNLLNGVDVSATSGAGPVVIHNNVLWSFGQANLLIYNPAGTFRYKIQSAAIGADRTITLPNLIANTTMAVLDFAETFTKTQTISVVDTAGFIVNAASTPTGSASEFVGGSKYPTATVAFATTPQSNDYILEKLDQSTLTNPSSGTVPNAATLKIVGAPIASTNVVITNPYSLWVAAGTTYLQGGTKFGSQVNLNGQTILNTGTITFPTATTTLAGLNVAQTWLQLQTFTTGLLQPADIVDSNGLKILSFSATASAVDYITLKNSASSTPSYIIDSNLNAGGATSFGTGVVRAYKFTGIPVGSIISSVGVNVTSSAGNVRVKVYQDDGTGGTPSTLLAESNAIAMSGGATGGVWQDISLNSSATVTASGNVWAAVESSTSVGFVFASISSNCASVAHTFGTGPTPFGVATTGTISIQNIRITMTAPTGTVTISNTGTDGYINTVLTPTGSLGLAQIKVNGTTGNILSSAGATASATSAAPSGTTSTTAVMMGVNATITPVSSTRVMVIASGMIANSLINDGATVQLRYNVSGAVPINADAVRGTQAGISQTVTEKVAAESVGFCITAIVTGLTIGTFTWFDIALNAVTAGTASATGVMITVHEI